LYTCTTRKIFAEEVPPSVVETVTFLGPKAAPAAIVKTHENCVGVTLDGLPAVTPVPLRFTVKFVPSNPVPVKTTVTAELGAADRGRMEARPKVPGAPAVCRLSWKRDRSMAYCFGWTGSWIFELKTLSMLPANV
jgi:hypothetical protein